MLVDNRNGLARCLRSPLASPAQNSEILKVNLSQAASSATSQPRQEVLKTRTGFPAVHP